MGKKVCGVAINDLKGWANRDEDGYKRRVYKLWLRMIRRCYGQKELQNRPSYQGSYVCSRWLIFSNFVKDLPKIPNYDIWLNNPKKRITLDKDYVKRGNKEYSLDYVGFVTDAESSRESITRNRANQTGVGSQDSLQKIGQSNSLSRRKPIKAIRLSDGKEFDFESRQECCKILGLDNSHVGKVLNGKEKQHKGYTFRYL